jgi:hypothetical protein
MVEEGDILLRFPFVNAELDDGGRIDRAAIGRGCTDSLLAICFPAVGVGMHRHEHLAPEPHALARSGCWITTNSYVSCLPSFVTRVMLLRVSLFTMMVAMVTVETPSTTDGSGCGGRFRWPR